MTLKIHPRRPIGQLSKMIDFVPAEHHAKLREVIHTAEFRVLDTLEDQIIYLREHTDLSFQHLHFFLDVHQSTLHRYYQAAIASRSAAAAPQPSIRRYGPNSALTIEGEEQVISWISEKQREQDCPSPRAVREFAAAIRAKERNVPLADGEHLSRDWWHHFKKRHEDLIAVKVAVSREAARTRISRDCVYRYFREMEEVMKKIETPRQVLNMDETGFHSRIEKNRRRKCVFHKKCTTHVTFSEEANSTTLSLMATICGDGGMLPPMFVCKENVPLSSYELQTLRNRFYVTRSPKGYATEQSMLDWITKVLDPYVQSLTAILCRPDSLVYLIMDNCGVHNTPAVRAKLNQIPRLHIIWLPPHTSHFLQMLDASVFGQLKGVYRNLRTTPTRPKIEGKILRAFHALWNAAYPRHVLAGFELTGFSYATNQAGLQTLRLDTCRATALLETNCQGLEMGATHDAREQE